jgi:tetratricopeptide (TPR) repeat protein
VQIGQSLKMSNLKFLSGLEQQQLFNPANPVLAHDVGLAHYWQAKKAGRGEEAIAHWQKVIANWAMVLGSDKYWQEWCAERSQIYKKPITDEHITDVKEQLTEKLLEELANIARLDCTETGRHLEAAFYLEVKAIRLLKQLGGLSFSTEADTKLYCGPLLVEQLRIFTQIKSFTKWPKLHEVETESLKAILAPIQLDEERLANKRHMDRRQLWLCFSQLGIPAVYLERSEPQRALSLLSNIRCSSCAPNTDQKTSQSSIAFQLPIQCRNDCEEFAPLNPAYASIVNGREIFYRHTIELISGAYLSLARQALTVYPTDITGILKYVHEALKFSQTIGLYEALKAKIADVLLGWANGLEHNQRIDETIALLEEMHEFDKKGRWKRKLVGLLNLRGIKNFKENRREQALTDLRRAYQLNRDYPDVYTNLEHVLYACYEDAVRDGNDALVRALADEIAQLDEVKPVIDTPPKNGKDVIIFPPSELANPALFNERGGMLKLEMFNDSGQTILALACEAAATMGEKVLGSSALMLALTRFEGGETLRLLKLQGFSPQKLQDQGAIPTVSTPNYSKPISTLSQFDFWPDALNTLNLAWKIAQYDRYIIGEPHILYAMLIHHRTTKFLQAAGVDVEQMIEQAGWY